MMTVRRQYSPVLEYMMKSDACHVPAPTDYVRTEGGRNPRGKVA